VIAAQAVSRNHAGNSGSHDGDSHDFMSPAASNV
jgi:hypothetical protein